MTLVKICGLTNIEDAIHAKQSGADLLGLIFVSKSKRCITKETAMEIAFALNRDPIEERLHFPKDQKNPQAASKTLELYPRKPLLVGVFQNESADVINDVALSVGLDLIQLHGDEPVDFPLRLCRPTIRALGVEPGTVPSQFYEQTISKHEAYADFFLLDTKCAEGFGGLGECFDWSVATYLTTEYGLPFFLAGGLRPETVQDALASTKVFGVDVSSGVESAVGKKNHEKVCTFIQRVKQKQ